ncbi:hypothetical protein [Bdellovibrio sp. HCB-110]|uniref:hypothetical protein n=1 Tax=Bdellovibrio sp. HCB-110 TaxID=3391182 RepID=UPI0039B5ADF8
MEKKTTFLKVKELESLHLIALDFCQYIQAQYEEQGQYDLRDPKIDQGVNLGVRSVILLLSELLLTEKGQFEKEKIQILLKNIKNKEEGKAY